MQLCADCVSAERDAFHPVYRHPLPCCMARAICDEPTTERKREFAKRVKTLLEPAEWAAVLERISELTAKGHA